MAKERSNERKSSKFTNVGALWRTTKGSKNVLASGTLQMDGKDGETFDILIMKNDKGDNEKRPDFRVVIVSEDEEPTKGNKKSSKKNDSSDDSDIPF